MKTSTLQINRLVGRRDKGHQATSQGVEGLQSKQLRIPKDKGAIFNSVTDNKN